VSSVVHIDTLQPSDADMISLVAAIHPRFLDLCDLYLRVRHTLLIPPLAIQPAMLAWRAAFNRYQSGDYRHSESEKKGTWDFAQWTVDLRMELTNQPKKTVEFR